MKKQEKRDSLKKTLLSVACLAFLVCDLSACTSTADRNQAAPATGSITTQVGEDGADSQTDTQPPATSLGGNALTDLVEPVKLPGEYLITYEVVENEQIRTISKGQDQEGRIYFRSGDEVLLFVPAPNGRYQEYQPDGDETFVPSSSNLCTAKYVETAAAEFMEYAQQSTKRFNGVSELTGTQKVAGRLCDLYTFDVTVLNFTNQYTLAIDQETGACMLWQRVTGVSGHVTSEDGSFTCTEFISENVELPISF